MSFVTQNSVSEKANVKEEKFESETSDENKKENWQVRKSSLLTSLASILPGELYQDQVPETVLVLNVGGRRTWKG